MAFAIWPLTLDTNFWLRCKTQSKLRFHSNKRINAFDCEILLRKEFFFSLINDPKIKRKLFYNEAQK